MGLCGVCVCIIKIVFTDVERQRCEKVGSASVFGKIFTVKRTIPKSATARGVWFSAFLLLLAFGSGSHRPTVQASASPWASPMDLRRAFRVIFAALMLSQQSNLASAAAATSSIETSEQSMGTLHKLRIFVSTSIAGLSEDDHARFDMLLAVVSFLCIPCAACSLGYYLRWSFCPGEWQRASDYAKWRAEGSAMV